MNQNIIKQITKLFISRNILPVDGLCDIWHEYLKKYNDYQINTVFKNYICKGDNYPSLPAIIKELEAMPDPIIKKILAAWESVSGYNATPTKEALQICNGINVPAFTISEKELELQIYIKKEFMEYAKKNAKVIFKDDDNNYISET